MSASTLVIQTAFLGDVVLTTPLLSALATRDGPVDVVTTPAAAPLLETHPAVERVIRYDKRGRDAGPVGLWRLGRELRGAGYSRVVLSHRSWRSAALALLAGAPERIGFADAPAALTYTRRIPRPQAAHETERLLALAEPAPDESYPLSLGLTGADHAEADRWLAEHGVGVPFVAMAPGSVWGTKRWPGYPALAAELPCDIVAIGGPDDAMLANQLAAAAGPRGHSAAGVLSIRASAALIERAAALVSNDSAPMHLAGAVGTPVVAIFGPTVPAFGFAPQGPSDRVIELSLACRPCSRHGPQVCPLGHHHCMTRVAPAVVAAAVSELIAPPAAGEDSRAVRAGH